MFDGTYSKCLGSLKLFLIVTLFIVRSIKTHFMVVVHGFLAKQNALN